MERMACHPEIVDEVIQDARAGMTEAEKRTHARKLNMARRQLTQEQRRELIRQENIENPWKSARAIAKELGVSPQTVTSVRNELLATAQIEQSDTILGADGREYQRSAVSRPKPKEENGELCKLHSSIGADGKQYPRQVERNRQAGTGENRKNPEEERSGQIDQCSGQTLDGRTYPAERKSPEPIVIGTMVKAPPFLDEEDKPVVIEPRRPVSVFNPTKREERALQKPEVVKRMSEANPAEYGIPDNLSNYRQEGEAYSLMEAMTEFVTWKLLSSRGSYHNHV